MGERAWNSMIGRPVAAGIRICRLFSYGVRGRWRLGTKEAGGWLIRA